MYTEDDLLPLSALQHLAFCERQWGLIHLEQIWVENQLTAAGRVEHEKVDSGESESRGTVRTVFSLRLRSLRLGLIGKADVVEFHLTEPGGVWTPFPVEHKHGKPKLDDCDEVQLCAQAICLEEMLDIPVPVGALFYGKPRRRKNLDLSASLRERTQALATRLHELTLAGVTPSGVYEKKCDSCSLISQCLPKVSGGGRSASAYLARAVAEASKEG
jgi:CRISPR-associated exonuclease Cas4